MATAIELPSVDETIDLLVTILAGVAVGTKARWCKLIVIGPLPAWQYVGFNWRVKAAGTAQERDAIDHAVEIVRSETPYIAAG